MKQIIKIRKLKIWFGRWSHKPWSVFSSIKKIIHILRVTVNICQQSLLKQGTIHKKTLSGIFFSDRILSALIDWGNLKYKIFLFDNFLSSKNDFTLEEAQNRVFLISLIYPTESSFALNW